MKILMTEICILTFLHDVMTIISLFLKNSYLAMCRLISHCVMAYSFVSWVSYSCHGCHSFSHDGVVLLHDLGPFLEATTTESKNYTYCYTSKMIICHHCCVSSL